MLDCVCYIAYVVLVLCLVFVLYVVSGIARISLNLCCIVLDVAWGWVLCLVLYVVCGIVPVLCIVLYVVLYVV